MNLKEVCYLLRYDGLALKVGRWLKGYHFTVSIEFCIQVVISISILRVLDKCDSDRLLSDDLNQISCLVHTEPHRNIGGTSEISPTADLD